MSRKQREPADVRRYRLQQEAKQKKDREDKALFKKLNDRLTELEKEVGEEKKPEEAGKAGGPL
jgi:hypothetical protein